MVLCGAVSHSHSERCRILSYIASASGKFNIISMLFMFRKEHISHPTISHPTISPIPRFRIPPVTVPPVHALHTDYTPLLSCSLSLALEKSSSFLVSERNSEVHSPHLSVVFVCIIPYERQKFVFFQESGICFVSNSKFDFIHFQLDYVTTSSNFD